MSVNSITKAFLFCLSSIFLTSLVSMPVNSGEKVAWSYGGSQNATVWGEISQDYATCSVGKHQSPINLSSTNASKAEGKIEFYYQPTDLVIKNNGNTIQVDYTPGSYAMIDGEKYNLLQFHFHTPSEHTVDGKASALELHLVHQNSKGQLAVIGILWEEGNKNEVLEAILENSPTTLGTKEVKNESINVALLLPKNQSHYHYSGSLTTPPCSEGVNWNVMITPIQASKQQIDKFMAIYSFNSRPIQPLYDRTVEMRP